MSASSICMKHLLHRSEVPSGAFLFNAHGHNWPESLDAQSHWSQRVVAAKQAGWNAIAKTNHDHVGYSSRQEAQAESAGVLVLEGAEFTTRLGHRLPHMLVYSASSKNLRRFGVPPFLHTPTQLLRWAQHQPDTFVAFAHPLPDELLQDPILKNKILPTERLTSFRMSEIETLVNQFPEMIASGMLGLEVINKRWRDYSTQLWEFCDATGVIPIAGCDDHSLKHLRIGAGMWFEETPSSARELLKALSAGKGGTFYQAIDEKFTSASVVR